MIYSKRYTYPPDAVLVDRSTKFGNPFPITPSRSREQAIREYVRWLYDPERQALRDEIRATLAGKDLLCWCAPPEGIHAHDYHLICHAQIIASLADYPEPEEV